MKYRKLGNSDLLISEIGFGSWLTFTDPQRKQLAISCVHRALDLGINFLDTANVFALSVRSPTASTTCFRVRCQGNRQAPTSGNRTHGENDRLNQHLIISQNNT